MPSKAKSKPCRFRGNEPSPTGKGRCAHGERIGKIAKGTDGALWRVLKYSKGRRWVRTSHKSQSATSKKSSAKKSTRAFGPWLEKLPNHVFLTMKEVEHAKHSGESLTLAVSVDQGKLLYSGKIVRPQTGLAEMKETLKGRDLKDFYEGPGGLAVLGSGMDRSILWSRLPKLPSFKDKV